MPASVNESLFNGESGAWKPRDEEWVPEPGRMQRQLRAGINPGQQYKREALASDIASIVGMDDLVPETVVREVDGKIGSM